MTPKGRKAVGPYLGILACLFVLCATAPRSWQRIAEPNRHIAQPVAPQAGRLAAAETRAPSSEPQIAATPTTQNSAVAETPAPKTVIAEASQGPQLTADPGAFAKPVLAAEPAPVTVRVQDSSDRLALRSVRSRRPSLRLPGRQPQVVEAQPGKPPAPQWAKPDALLAQLDELAKHSETADWATAAAEGVRQLLSTAEGDAGAARAALQTLRASASRAEELAEQMRADALRAELLRARYALVRRMDVWQLAASLQQSPPPAVVRSDAHLNQPLAELASLTSESEHGRAWRNYLMLDALHRTLQRGPRASEQEKQVLAQRIMERIAAARRSESHQQFVSKGPVAQLDLALRKWSAEPVAPLELLAHLEAYERTRSSAAAEQLAADYRSLLYSPKAEHRELAKQVARHYRNANVRLAVTAEFLNRGLPELPTVQERIRDHILGADVSGRSATSTELEIKLLPERGKLRMALRALGTVNSKTQSSSGPARIHSAGLTSYLAEKVIEVGPNGLFLAPADAYARANMNLLGLNTDYDEVPLIGSIVRSVALSQQSESHQDALREMEWRVARAARERMNSDADAKIFTAAQRIEQQVWARLKRLGLEPQPLELNTTEQRMVVRLRLAGDEQLGAHTPRPRALSNSLLSLQLHESVLNNTVGQLGLDGKTFELHQLYEHLGRRLEVDLPVPDDLPPETRVTFAPRDAVQIHCREGLIKITLAIAEIEQPRRAFRHFKVHAFYRPETEGITARLEREETIQLEGHDLGFGGQIVLRGVFSKIFSRNRALPIIPAQAGEDPRLKGLEINQLVIEDGWIGFSLAEPLAPRKQPVAWQPRGAAVR